MITTMQQMADDIIRDRASNLLKSIKLETHWNLLSAPARTLNVDESTYRADRATLVALWPDIRHRRIKSSILLVDLVADQASLLTALIEVRRQRASRRAASPIQARAA